MKEKQNKFIVMLFPTDRADDIVWLNVNEQFKIEKPSLSNDHMNWGNICNATKFSTAQQAKKFARISQELWHISFSKVLEINWWEIEQIKNLQS
ncbi:hypothetical protein VNN36_07200 [Lactococcus garvieae]|uniref:hypothetical protein n=1 Tax=Lactococcus garvieae TaxID=1363 RepID=UPI0030D4FA0E